MKIQGLSWSEIASSLDIGRTTARRLVSLYQKDEDGQINMDGESNRKVNGTFSENEDNHDPLRDAPVNQTQNDQFPSNDDIFSRLPKTFKIFSSLLKKARGKQSF